jgi:hypothetical protein
VCLQINPSPPEISLSTENGFQYNLEKDCCRKGGHLCLEYSLSVDACNEMVLIDPTGMKLPDKTRRRLHTNKREFKLQKCLRRHSRNRREDNNRNESEINNNADTVSDYANDCGNVQKR